MSWPGGRQETMERERQHKHQHQQQQGHEHEQDQEQEQEQEQGQQQILKGECGKRLGQGMFLSDEDVDQLDDEGVPCEYVATLAERETKAFRVSDNNVQTESLSGQVREVALCFMSQLAHLVRMEEPEKAAFDAALLLDLFMLRGGTAASLDAIPATCIAILSILKKQESCTFKLNASIYCSMASQFVSWLQRDQGILVPCSETHVVAQERMILEALGWDINTASTSTWLHLISTRFNILTKGIYATSLDWVLKQSVANARVLLTRYPSTPELPPSVLAKGLFTLNLANAKMVPWAVLKPEKLSAKAWDQALVSAQPQVGVPACCLTPALWGRLLRYACIATDSSVVHLSIGAYRMTSCNGALVEAHLAFVGNTMQSQSGNSSPSAHTVRPQHMFPIAERHGSADEAGLSTASATPPRRSSQ